MKEKQNVNRYPVGHDRASTIDMFLDRGLANFLNFQVDAIEELSFNYDDLTSSMDEADIFPDPITDEGGTSEHAYWIYGLECCTR